MDARQKRYTVLDSWRGISACLVVLLHCEIHSHIDGLGFFRGGFLWVDFFFVLSGFVITENYHDRIIRGFPIRKFLLLPLGRIYPLHAFVLALLLARELTQRVLSQGTLFANPAFSFASLLANLLLVHSLGLFSRVTWNVPSWSISAEFVAYILFAAGIGLLGSKLRLAELALVILLPLALASVHGDMNVTCDWGALLCVYGFGAGALCYRLHVKYLRGLKAPFFLMTIVEAVLATGAGLFVCYASPSRIGIASPYMFSLLVLAFAQEGGALSKVLKTRFMVSLGLLSYSIYMLQYFIQTLFYHAAPVFGYVLKQSDPIRGFRQGHEVRLLPVTIGQGDLMIIVIMVCVVTASVFTRRWVELPANKWIRGLADRQWPACTD